MQRSRTNDDRRLSPVRILSRDCNITVAARHIPYSYGIGSISTEVTGKSPTSHPCQRRMLGPTIVSKSCLVDPGRWDPLPLAPSTVHTSAHGEGGATFVPSGAGMAPRCEMHAALMELSSDARPGVGRAFCKGKYSYYTEHECKMHLIKSLGPSPFSFRQVSLSLSL